MSQHLRLLHLAHAGTADIPSVSVSSKQVAKGYRAWVARRGLTITRFGKPFKKKKV